MHRRCMYVILKVLEKIEMGSIHAIDFCSTWLYETYNKKLKYTEKTLSGDVKTFKVVLKRV